MSKHNHNNKKKFIKRENEKKNERPAKETRTYTGIIQLKKNGSGRVICNDIEANVFIPSIYTNGAFDNDSVEISLIGSPKYFDVEGKVVRVLKRNTSQYVAEIHIKNNQYFAVCDNEMVIRLKKKKVEAKWKDVKEGILVVIDIDDWHDPITAHIVEVLGEASDPHISMIRIARKYGFREEFSPQIMDSLESYSQEYIEQKLAERTDLRHETIFTIDPTDAKDFDDAISIKKNDDGSFDLGVHIADVSSYIPEDGPLDKEAAYRGCSLYLPSSVIPMLPRKLSNYLCSLNPDVDRLAFSCFMRIDKFGNIEKYHFKETVIRSAMRFDYINFQQLFETLENEKQPEEKYNGFEDLVKWSYELKRILKEKRKNEGSIEFDLPEIKVVLDADGNTIDIRKYQLFESNSVIEEFMLAANICSADFLAQRDQKLPAVYRIHEKPSQEKILHFFDDLENNGIKIKRIEDLTDHKFIQNTLEQVKKAPNGDIISMSFLRAMMKAKYSTDNIGHYGLAFKLYTHFTSPIRRYPDLMVHRLIKKHLKKLSINKAYDNKKVIEEKCMQSTVREISAIKAEYEARDLKIIEYMIDKIGNNYSGVVVSVVPFGVYVRLKEIPIEGLIRMRNEHSDQFDFIEDKNIFKGKRTGLEIHTGKDLEIKISNIDREMLTIDFELVKKK
ncbi:MAG: ribonuclease R [Candidatus Delongbacteria bacterium]|nr:ribonuclease R [Candidatus Delongbacteria bacterium]